MKRIALALSVFLIPVAAQSAPDKQEISLKVVQDYVIPAYERFATDAKKQAEQWQKTCDVESLKPTYQETTDTWARIQHFNFGPITLLLRRDRLYHWPERRNAVSKSLNKALADKDPELLKADNFSHTSVALQGLPALERVLYTDKVQSDYGCQIGKAIAANISEIAYGTYKDWQETVTFIQEGKAHPIYFSSMNEVAIRLFTELLTGFQMISDQKISLPMGSSLEKANGKKAESWRSGRSTRYIKQNTKGLMAMAKPFMSFLSKDKAKEIEAQFSILTRALNELPPSIKEGVGNEEVREKIKAFLDVNQSTRSLLVDVLTKQLDLTIGFNSLDGD